jgi:CubicO group peptidase (beta-lactamase class C family)
MIATPARTNVLDTSSANANAVAVSPMKAAVDQVLNRALAEMRIVGAVVLVAQDGQLVYHSAVGLADREAHKPMREDALFRLSSVTKPIVTAAALRLVHEGRMTLDDSVTQWLPYFTPPLPDGRTPVITLRQLLNHTSGLSYGFQEPDDGIYHQLGVSDGLDESGITLDENLQRLARAPLHFSPGTEWRYSLGMDVMGAVIERVTGTSLPQAIDALVTGPLHMRDTGFAATEPRGLVTPYIDGKPEPVRMADDASVALPADFGFNVHFSPGRASNPNAFPSGGAGMVATAGDVLALLEAIRLGKAPLTPAVTLQMMSAHVGAEAQTQGPGWGFGFGGAMLVDPVEAQTPQGKGTLQWGGVYGHNWFIDPVHQLSVVLLTNTTYEGMIGALTVELRDAIYAAQA